MAWPGWPPGSQCFRTGVNSASVPRLGLGVLCRSVWLFLYNRVNNETGKYVAFESTVARELICLSIAVHAHNFPGLSESIAIRSSLLPSDRSVLLGAV